MMSLFNPLLFLGLDFGQRTFSLYLNFLMKIRNDVALFDHTVYCIRMFYESNSLTN